MGEGLNGGRLGIGSAKNNVRGKVRSRVRGKNYSCSFAFRIGIGIRIRIAFATGGSAMHALYGHWAVAARIGPLPSAATIASGKRSHARFHPSFHLPYPLVRRPYIRPFYPTETQAM